jgi:hypothetical protein
MDELSRYTEQLNYFSIIFRWIDLQNALSSDRIQNMATTQTLTFIDMYICITHIKFTHIYL